MAENEPVVLSEEQLDEIIGGITSVLGNNGVQGISAMDLSSVDIETALMMVQAQRTNLLDAQLQNQLSDVSKRNEQISTLNQFIGVLREAGGHSDPNLSLDSKIGSDPQSKTFGEKFDELGIKADGDGNGSLDRNEINSALDAVKGQLDSMSNSQQMDTLRLQALSDKRNEAFDLMSNFIKKMQDSRSSIIGNMR